MTRPPEIRTATPSDASAVVEFLSLVKAEQLTTTFGYDNVPSTEKQAEALRKLDTTVDGVCLLALVDESVVGHLNLTCGNLPQLRHAAMLGMLVLSSKRAKGIGSQLLNAGIDWALAKGLRKLQLEVMSNNPRAQSLYERFGFKVEGARKEVVLVHDSYVDLVQMGLALPPERRITIPRT